ncbi:MAG: TetR/AcrR family transcriptional regulator [Dysgonamonadaceae bacterium]|nr:TetR/AcrR family transcriptional regulator [Dysgonamonadaceae bacterium]
MIEVARQLFAQQGVENTTMSDIAKASNKSRRTLYTYFESKQDIYNAVIQSELESLYLQLEEVIKRKLPADDKLMIFFFTRLEAIKDVVTRNGTLRADFFRDIWLVEYVRKVFDRKEIAYLQDILEEGVRTKIFEITDVPKTARILHYALKGLEVPVIRGVFSLNINNKSDRDTIVNLIFRGLYREK